LHSLFVFIPVWLLVRSSRHLLSSLQNCPSSSISDHCTVADQVQRPTERTNERTKEGRKIRDRIQNRSKKQSMMDQQDDDIVSLPEDRKDDRRYPARSRSPVRLYKPPRDSVGQPDFLNESTLIALSTYLLTHRDRLDEDELTNHMVHIDAVTTDRMRYSDFGNDSDEEEGLEDIYRQEEDSVLAQDFFKQAVTIAQEAAPLDKRTINWIRKEMGFVKKKDEILAKSSVAKAKDHNTDESEDSGEQPQMRLTRTQARNTRVKKREERSAKDNQGLQDLFAAVNELELDLGRPFGHADADTVSAIFVGFIRRDTPIQF